MIGIKQIKDVQKRKKGLTNIIEIKLLGKETCEKYGITVQQSLDILNGRYDDILTILNGVKVETTGGNVSYTLPNGLVINLNC